MQTQNHKAGPRLLTDSLWGLALLLLALLLSMQTLRLAQERQAALLAPGVLRLHILADSNRPADQEVKLEVRSLILDFLRARSSEAESKASVLNLLHGSRPGLLADIDRHLAARGFPYRAALSFVRCYFPTRSYGGAVYPCGVYDAVRVTLGRGQGRNWWCVLYPQLCLAGETLKSPTPSDAKREKTPALTDASPSVTLKFRLLPGFSLRLPAPAANPRSPVP